MATRKPTYAVREFTIPAGGSVETYRQADFLTCLEANTGFKVSFDNAPKVDFETGLTLRTVEGFTRVEISNPSGGDLVVKLGFGMGDISDARLVLSGAIGTKQFGAASFVTGAPVSALDAAATLLAAANDNRAEIILTNDGAGRVYIGGDAGAVAGEGLPLDAGGSLVLSTSAAVYARNDSGAAVSVAVAEMERV